MPLGLLWAVSETELGWRTYKPGRREGADRGSLPLMISISTAAALAAIGLWYLGIGRIPGDADVLAAAGLTVATAGVALRWWAILTLRGQFTINVAALSEHRLIKAGPYRIVRHPAYTGTLTTLLGLGLALGNALSLALLVLCPLAALLYRIGVEEKVLGDLFGQEFDDYRSRTWRLLPGLY